LSCLADCLCRSDFVCPWCFLGSVRLAAALSKVKARRGKQLIITVRFRPYLLIKSLTADTSIPKRYMYLKRFKGDVERVDAMECSFKEMFAPFGETYSLDGQVGSTLAAHCLVEWVGHTNGSEVQWNLANEIFRLYHSQGVDIAKKDVLVRAAQAVGLAKEQVVEALEGLEFEEKVLSQAANSASTHKLSIMSGVPHVKLSYGGLSYEIPGAQDVAYFERIIEKLIEKSSKL